MKTTTKQFELFKNECKKWINKFELNHIKVYFSHKQLKNVYATIYTDLINSIATIEFNLEPPVDEKIDDNKIKEIAKHEVIHLLLSNIIECAYSRFTTKDNLIMEEEKLVRKLQYII